METLKLVTLAILIPIGSLMSEATVAYPEPVDQMEIVVNHGPEAHCSSRKLSPPELTEQETRSHAHSESVTSLIAPTNTAPIHR